MLLKQYYLEPEYDVKLVYFTLLLISLIFLKITCKNIKESLFKKKDVLIYIKN